MATDGYRNIGIAMRHVASSGSVDIDIFVDGSLILSGTISTNLNDPLISRFATRSRSATYSGSEYNGLEVLEYFSYVRSFLKNTPSDPGDPGYGNAGPSPSGGGGGGDGRKPNFDADAALKPNLRDITGTTTDAYSVPNVQTFDHVDLIESIELSDNGTSHDISATAEQDGSPQHYRCHTLADGEQAYFALRNGRASIGLVIGDGVDHYDSLGQTIGVVGILDTDALGNATYMEPVKSGGLYQEADIQPDRTAGNGGVSSITTSAATAGNQTIDDLLKDLKLPHPEIPRWEDINAGVRIHRMRETGEIRRHQRKRQADAWNDFNTTAAKQRGGYLRRFQARYTQSVFDDEIRGTPLEERYKELYEVEELVYSDDYDPEGHLKDESRIARIIAKIEVHIELMRVLLSWLDIDYDDGIIPDLVYDTLFARWTNHIRRLKEILKDLGEKMKLLKAIELIPILPFAGVSEESLSDQLETVLIDTVAGAATAGAGKALNSARKAKRFVTPLGRSRASRRSGSRINEAARQARVRARAQGYCFPAGTLVHTEDGLVPIEEIEVGDLVWAYGTETGAWSLEEVLATSKRWNPGGLVSFTVTDANGYSETIQATWNHPIWVTDGLSLESRAMSSAEVAEHEPALVGSASAASIASGSASATPSNARGVWIRAQHLRSGDALLSRNDSLPNAASGNTATPPLTLTAISSRRAPGWVYNLAVANTHSYTVGTNGLLTHNGDCAVLPGLDSTGKVHGALPRPKDLSKYGADDLKQFRKDLQSSVKERIAKTVEHGRDRPHGQRQGREQDLIESIEKRLDSIGESYD